MIRHRLTCTHGDLLSMMSKVNIRHFFPPLLLIYLIIHRSTHLFKLTLSIGRTKIRTKMNTDGLAYVRLRIATCTGLAAQRDKIHHPSINRRR